MGECESLENYLKQILILLETKGYARSKDIADSMGVSKPSVCVAMKKLKENGCIMMSNRSPVCLTDKGYAIARHFYDRYKTLTRILIQLRERQSRSILLVIHSFFLLRFRRISAERFSFFHQLLLLCANQRTQ